MIHVFEGQQLRLASDNYYIAPGAQLIGDVRLGDWASVWFNAVLRADDERIEIGWIGHSAIPLTEQAQRYLAELRTVVASFGVVLLG